MSSTDEPAPNVQELQSLINGRLQAQGYEERIVTDEIRTYWVGPRNEIVKLQRILAVIPTDEEKSTLRKILSAWMNDQRENKPQYDPFRGFLQDGYRVQFFVERRREEGAPVEADCLEDLRLDPNNPAKLEYDTRDKDDKKIIERWLKQEARRNPPSNADRTFTDNAKYNEIFDIHFLRYFDLQIRNGLVWGE
ncbi:hypothetical protein BO94DRAFT_548850 [Aspergillus sclerotioniger CBS 115572]|uniref:Uncharacterized protein n=1 Tax=Aspergillus sclerotioniger CBS 115572 TaxID=1450535 RepID=A0A317W1K3_9EURO|nr:hypothetical protein BO94DRAFT_548850 [Aspergillus sclerotioniger CBS 115572]PWY78050.1 hypothetical protein BO94DRAFT_548850 [Aspergillus sclerotioniger CBS 115572]